MSAWVTVEPANVVVSALKQCEDDERIVVRYFDMEGKDSTAELIFFRPIESIEHTNLIEEEGRRGVDLVVLPETWRGTNLVEEMTGETISAMSRPRSTVVRSTIVRMPRVASKSFAPYGMPCSKPRYAPRVISRSARRA